MSVLRLRNYAGNVISFVTGKGDAQTISFSFLLNDSTGLNWKMGDGTVVSSNNQVSHTYSTIGDKTVSVAYDKNKVVNEFKLDDTLIKGELDLSKIKGISAFRIINCPDLSGIVFPELTAVVASFEVYQNIGITSLDLSNVKKIGGSLIFRDNTALTSITFPSTASDTDISAFHAQYCNLTGTLDLSKLTNLGGDFNIRDNPNLTDLILPTAPKAFGSFQAITTGLNKTLPIGTKIIATTIAINNCGMTQANVDGNINNLYVNRLAFDNTQGKHFNIGDSNAAPSGTYQAPAGYIQATTGVVGDDGTPASAKEQIYVLLNQNEDNSTTNKYKWSTFRISGTL